MTTIERQIAKKFYNEACHGAGAVIRRSAGASLENMIREAGYTLFDGFEELGLNMANYFAAKPI